MAKYFEIAPCKNGSWNDTMGRTVTATGSPEIKRGEKGNAINTTNVNYLTYSSSLYPAGAFTVVVFAKAPTKNIYAGSAGLKSGNPRGVMTAGGTTGATMIWLGSNNFVYFTGTQDAAWHCYIFTIPGSAQTDINSACCYKDGVSLVTPGATTTSVQDSRTTWVNIYGGWIAGQVNNISYLATYDHIFTEEERAAAYKDFLNSYPIVKEKYPKANNKPMDLSREVNNTVGSNLIPLASSNFDTDGTAWWELSGTGNRYWSGTYFPDFLTMALSPTATAPTVHKDILTSGKTYKVSFKVMCIGGHTEPLVVKCGTTTVETQTFLVTSDWQYFSANILSNGANFSIGVKTIIGGSVIYLDDIVVQELTGLVAAYNFQVT